MLTNLDFINQGEIWPPASERKRLESYEANRKLYKGEFDDIFALHHERIDKTLLQTLYITSLNYFRKVSHKTAGLLWGEPPKLDATGKNENQYKALNNIIKSNDIYTKGRSITIDLSRYGNSLLYVRKLENNFGVIECISPAIWFPVVKPDNIKEYAYHVLAWKYKENVDEKDKWYLKLQIHSKGNVTLRTHELTGGNVIGELTEDERTVTTGLNDFAIIPISSVDLTDDIYGESDYDDFQSIVTELMVRITQVNKILDKHSMPSMQGPKCALKENPKTGRLELTVGDYFINQTESATSGNVSYITWDAQLDANFKIIEVLLNQLYIISEMSSALLGGLNVSQGNIPSGSALKRLLISTLDKVNRFKQAEENALKKAIILCSRLGGEKIIPIDDVSITWQDGLPGDPKEEAEIMQIRTANKPTMSVYRVLTQYDNMNDVDAQSELNTIYEEEAMNDPMSGVANADPEEIDAEGKEDDEV